jgi:hypothetical protein
MWRGSESKERAGATPALFICTDPRTKQTEIKAQRDRR